MEGDFQGNSRTGAYKHVGHLREFFKPRRSMYRDEREKYISNPDNIKQV